VVEPPDVDRVPIQQIGYNRFVLPQKVVHLQLVTVITFRFPDDDHQSCFIPGRRLVDETDAFDDHVFIDVTGPVTAVRNFPRHTLRPIRLARVSDRAWFPGVVAARPSESLIDAGKLATTAGRKESEGFLRDRGSVPG